MARQQKSGGSELREAKSETDHLRSEHERLHSDYVSSKFEWQSLRERYLEVKAENERDTANYKSVKADFDHAHDAYIRRRDLVDRAPGEAHVSAKEFWGMKYIQEGSKKVKVKRHDHYMPDGSPAGKHKNRGNYTGDLNRD